MTDARSLRSLNAAKHFGAFIQIIDDLQDAEADTKRGRRTFATDLAPEERKTLGTALVRQALFHHARKSFRLLDEPQRDGYRFLWRMLRHQWKIFATVDANTINPPCTIESDARKDPPRATTRHGYYWGPLFIQPRVGRGGEDILVYKLRTMRAFGRDEEHPGVDQGTGKAVFADRVTPLGAHLRRYFIDEVPQVVNLLLGQLRLVGVRPMARPDYERLDPTIKEHYRKHGPAAMSVNYAFEGRPTEEDPDCRMQRAAFIENFFEQFSVRPARTTLTFAYRIAKAIVIDGKRGL